MLVIFGGQLLVVQVKTLKGGYADRKASLDTNKISTDIGVDKSTDVTGKTYTVKTQL